MDERQKKPWLYDGDYVPEMYSRKNISSARFLLIILFYFGGHKFYLREFISGIIWIALVWLLPIFMYLNIHKVGGYALYVEITFWALHVAVIIYEWKRIPQRVEDINQAIRAAYVRKKL